MLEVFSCFEIDKCFGSSGNFLCVTFLFKEKYYFKQNKLEIVHIEADVLSIHSLKIIVHLRQNITHTLQQFIHRYNAAAAVRQTNLFQYA